MTRRAAPFLAFVLLAAGCQDEGRRAPLQTHAKSGAGNDAEEDKTPPTAEEKRIAMERLDRAIAAHGGPVRLQKLRRQVQTLRGLVRHGEVGMIQAEQEIKIQLPDQLVTHVKGFLPRGAQEVRLGWTSNAGWVSQGGATVEMESVLARNMREELHYRRAQALLPLKDAEIALRPCDGPVLDRKKTVGIRVIAKEYANLELYFDDQKHLLIGVKCVRHYEGGVLQRREVILGDHKPIDEVVVPTRIKDVRDDVPWVDCSIDYKFVEKFDAKEFQKP